MISFDNQGALLFLLLIPAAWIIYAKYISKRIIYLSIDYSYGSLIKSLNLQPPLWKRLFYPGMLSIISTLLIIGMADPKIEYQTKTTNADIMVLLDTSISMATDDIEPSRLDVCTSEIVSFIQDLPNDTRIGLMSFSSDANVVIPLTREKDKIIRSVKNISNSDLRNHTDIGKALYIAYTTFLKEETVSKSERAIIILSDGCSTIETYSPTKAASEALENDIKVYTIGFGGTEDGFITWKNPETQEEIEYEVSAMKPDELQSISEAGGGTFFRAFNQEDLHSVYTDIENKTTSLIVEEYHIGFIFCFGSLIAIIFMIAGIFYFNWIFQTHI